MNKYQNVIEFIKSENTNNKNIQTGYRELDKAICHNNKGSLITIGGRPGMGKTAFLTTLTLNVITNDNSILFFSFKQSKEMLLKRLVLQHAKISSKKILQEPLSVEEEQSLEKSLEFIALKLCIEDKFNIDTKYIEEKIRRNKFDYLLIDGIQALRTEDLDKFLTKLKKVITKNGTTCFITSNLKREIDERVCRIPALGDLEGTTKLEELSDVVIFPYRQDYYDNLIELEDERFEKAEFYVEKNKFGPTWYIDMQFDKELACFEDLSHINIF